MKPQNETKKSVEQYINYTPLIVAKFYDFYELGGKQDIETLLGLRFPGSWDFFRKLFPGIKISRLITSVTEEQLTSLVMKASKNNPEYKPVNFMNYFAISCPFEINNEDVVTELKKWKAVQSAYVKYPAPPASVVVDNQHDPQIGNQQYLNESPYGIDAKYAWKIPGGDGAGQRFCNIDGGWTLGHEDLPTGIAPPTEPQGINPGSQRHGTSVLGIICAKNNDKGCVGIVPNLAEVKVSSSYKLDDQNILIRDFSNGLAYAVNSLQPGDVLLISEQTRVLNSNIYGPVELYDDVYDLIKAATLNGIIVVEPGGNGDENSNALNFDTYQNADRKTIFDRNSPDFKDSGAIIVSAGIYTNPHTRIPYAPYGNRIDCYGWGEHITTLDSRQNSTNAYRSDFDGTSGASAIIAGAALAVQGMKKNNSGIVFTASEMRVILSNAATGTPSTDAIGVMPDLKSIIKSQNFLPDVYIRDNITDNGLPHNGDLATSPDIILRSSAAVNPQQEFGTISENNNMLSNEAVTGRDNYVYVRVNNRGAFEAKDVVAKVYWSEPATLVTPDMWLQNQVGQQIVIPNVPVGALTVSDKIIWPHAEIPHEGHYCFIAIIGNELDPAPETHAFTWEEYIDFIRNNNNVTWRNFNVVQIPHPPPPQPLPAPQPPDQFIDLPFIGPGAFDKSRVFQFEVISKLPEGSTVAFEIPSYWAKKLNTKDAELNYKKEKGISAVAIKNFGTHLFEPIELEAKSKTKLRLLVNIPEKFRSQEYEIAVRQLWGKQEVGRITWRLVSKERKKDIENKIRNKNNEEKI